MINWNSKVMLYNEKYKSIFHLTNEDKLLSIYPDANFKEIISLSSVSKYKREISHRLCLNDNFFTDCYYSDVFVIKNRKDEIMLRKIAELSSGDKMAYYNFDELLFLPVVSFFSDTKKIRTYKLEPISGREAIIIVDGFLKRV